MPKTLHLLCMLLSALGGSVWAQSNVDKPSPIRLPETFSLENVEDETPLREDPDLGPLWLSDGEDFSIRSLTETPVEDDRLTPMLQSPGLQTPALQAPGLETPALQTPAVSNAFATFADGQAALDAVRPIPSFVPSHSSSSHRIVRYDVPLEDEKWHQLFLQRGCEGQLVEVIDPTLRKKDSLSDRLRNFLRPTASQQSEKKIRMVRYEVPAEDIAFHTHVSELDGQLLEPGMLRLPEVRFFQPKARVFMDLKRKNDGAFDLFDDGAILASLDVIELYFPMPLISERFSEMFGKPGRLSSIGWRVGGTIGLGITTALNNGSSDNGSAPVSTLSTGIRYEFPLGRPSREVIETGDSRLDQRTRVGMEFGFQGGISTREALSDSTDYGLYFGILVNTPWGG